MKRVMLVFMLIFVSIVLCIKVILVYTDTSVPYTIIGDNLPGEIKPARNAYVAVNEKIKTYIQDDEVLISFYTGKNIYEEVKIKKITYKEKLLEIHFGLIKLPNHFELPFIEKNQVFYAIKLDRYQVEDIRKVVAHNVDTGMSYELEFYILQ